MIGRVHILCSMMVMGLASGSVHADEFRSNAWGFYAGPTTYQRVSGSEYNEATSNTSLDLGVYYARFPTRSFSLRVEARFAQRDVDVYRSFWDVSDLTRVSEQFLEIPILIQADRRSVLAESEIRISAGIGFCYGVLIVQEWWDIEDHADDTEGFGGYQRLSLLFDGGATLDIHEGSGIFLRFRAQYDGHTFAASHEIDFENRYLSYGFYAGFESPF